MESNINQEVEAEKILKLPIFLYVDTWNIFVRFASCMFFFIYSLCCSAFRIVNECAGLLLLLFFSVSMEARARDTQPIGSMQEQR